MEIPQDFIFSQKFHTDGPLAHHHLLELVEVHGPAAVLVHLLDYSIQVLLGESWVDLSEDFLDRYLEYS